MSECKFKTGDKVELLEKYGLCRKGAVGVVTCISEGSDDFLLTVSGVCRAFAYRFKLAEASTTYPNPPHKHAEVIKAWADGAEVQVSSRRYDGSYVNWRNVAATNPLWGLKGDKFRIKPQPTPQELEIGKIEEEMRKLADRVKELKNG